MARADGVPDVSVVIPVHDEVESLPVLWGELRAVLDSLEGTAEVLFVNDGSHDGSDKLIRHFGDEDVRVRGVHLARRCGVSSAYKAGFDAARGDVVVTLDADLQIDPRDIPAMLAALRSADAAVGWRQARHDTLAKRVASRIANGLRRKVLGDRFHDSACSLRAMSRRCLTVLPPYDGMHRFVPVLLAMNGYVVAEVRISHRARRFGRSKFGIRDRAWRAFVDMLVVRWMRARRLSHLSDD
jgi:glycosyltransferase involved in cell wall biosynthesis